MVVRTYHAACGCPKYGSAPLIKIMPPPHPKDCPGWCCNYPAKTSVCSEATRSSIDGVVAGCDGTKRPRST